MLSYLKVSGTVLIISANTVTDNATKCPWYLPPGPRRNLALLAIAEEFHRSPVTADHHHQHVLVVHPIPNPSSEGLWAQGRCQAGSDLSLLVPLKGNLYFTACKAISGNSGFQTMFGEEYTWP